MRIRTIDECANCLDEYIQSWNCIHQDDVNCNLSNKFCNILQEGTCNGVLLTIFLETAGAFLWVMLNFYGGHFYC